MVPGMVTGQGRLEQAVRVWLPVGFFLLLALFPFYWMAVTSVKPNAELYNKNLMPLRNRIRHRVIPYIEKQFGRKVRESIRRAAIISAAEEDFFELLLPPKLMKSSELAVNQLRALPLAIQRRTLHEWLRASKIPNLSFDLIERVRALLDSNRIAKTNLPQDRHVRRRAKKLFIE